MNSFWLLEDYIFANEAEESLDCSWRWQNYIMLHKEFLYEIDMMTIMKLIDVITWNFQM